jgi:hypothetical protein
MFAQLISKTIEINEWPQISTQGKYKVWKNGKLQCQVPTHTYSIFIYQVPESYFSKIKNNLPWPLDNTYLPTYVDCLK